MILRMQIHLLNFVAYIFYATPDLLSAGEKMQGAVLREGKVTPRRCQLKISDITLSHWQTRGKLQMPD